MQLYHITLNQGKPVPDGALLISRREVRALLDLDLCLEAVEQAFRIHGQGIAAPPGLLSLSATDGAFHIKAALLEQDGRRYFVAKSNANFMGNRERYGLPTIQGVILLCDAERGRVLAVMDSIEITILRTGAATAVAARHLALPDASTVTIAGCGNQGRVQLRAVSRVMPVRRVFAFDADRAAAARFAADMSAELGTSVTVAPALGSAVRQSDLCVTCTPSKDFLIQADDVSPGTFVAGVGVDSSDKRELAPGLLARATIVADVVEQCAAIGDLHHAIAAGAVTRADVYAELGEIVAGRKPGRRRADEIIVFDSTGMALQDAAAAALVYRRALAAGRGVPFEFAGD